MRKRQTPDQLTPLELEIMKVLWEKSEATVSEVFAIVGQEFGLVGGITVIGLFLLIAWRATGARGGPSGP